MEKTLNHQYLYWQNQNIINRLIPTLQNGNIVITSTDTVLGLLGIVSQNTYENLNRVKQRSEKPYLILIESPKQLYKYTTLALNSPLNSLVEQCWPGPLTLVFKANPQLPAYSKGMNNTVALRCPHHPGLLTLLAHFDGLFSTSANLSNKPIPRTINELDPTLTQIVPYIVTDDPTLTESKDTPSTILDCTDENNITLIRPGSYPTHELEKLYGKEFIKLKNA